MADDDKPSVASEIIDGLTEFANDLKDGVVIEGKYRVTQAAPPIEDDEPPKWAMDDVRSIQRVKKGRYASVEEMIRDLTEDKVLAEEMIARLSDPPAEPDDEPTDPDPTDVWVDKGGEA